MNKDEIIAGIREIKAERDTFRAARDRLQEFIDTPDWGALDSGASIKADDVYRFGLARYRVRVDHVKALIRSPLNPVYFELEV